MVLIHKVMCGTDIAEFKPAVFGSRIGLSNGKNEFEYFFEV